MSSACSCSQSGGCSCAANGGKCSKPGGCTCAKPKPGASAKPAATPAASSCSWRCGVLRRASETWRRGMGLLAQGEPVQAERLQREALALVFGLGGFPVLRARIHNNLGVILSCSGRADEARREFANALFLVGDRIDPQSRFVQVLRTNLRSVAPQFSVLEPRAA